MMQKTRRAVAALIAMGGLCVAFNVQAQAWPAKPVKFVVGAAAGGEPRGCRAAEGVRRLHRAERQLQVRRPGDD